MFSSSNRYQMCNHRCLILSTGRSRAISPGCCCCCCQLAKNFIIASSMPRQIILFLVFFYGILFRKRDESSRKRSTKRDEPQFKQTIKFTIFSTIHLKFDCKITCGYQICSLFQKKKNVAIVN